ncbi:AfsR/SARP family transcriptional regulator [Streptomyces sp. NPDC050145]|uniref:AfsR/SARP family transcriptional regulator n=1 Tax=Streptomyces sp. NPDC050145 TaxID=3365602 RepID=UPI0037A9D432
MDSTTPRPLRIEVLGPLRAWRGTTPLEPGPIKRQAVLSALLLRHGAAVGHERLIDAVWGSRPPAGGRGVLPTHVNSLRRALDPPGTTPARSVIRSGKGWYRFAAEEVRLDTTDLEELGAEAMRTLASGDLAGAADQLSAAIGLFRGEPLAGLPGPFAREERGRWEERRRTLRLERLKCLVLTGRCAEVLDELGAVPAADERYDESLAALRIRALYGCGRQAQALNAFTDLRVRLRDELGADPGQELRRVHEAVLRHDDAFLLHPATPTPAVGRPAGVPAPAELPHDVAGFVGRAEELDELDALFRSEAGRSPAGAVVVSAIGGAAGIGKTALAVHWAHRARDRFPDGQLYINLHGFDPDRPPLDPGEALGLLLRSLGVAASEIPSRLEAQGRVYRTLLAGRRLLVLLDNAASAEQVRPLLPGSSACRVVVTSRNRLGGLVAEDGARALPLDLLRPPEALALLVRTLGADRVAADEPAAAELIRRCGGLPLALRLAAARLSGDPGLSLADLVAEMTEGERLAALEPDDDSDSPLRTAFSVSYQVLAPAARRLFRLLGLFPGTEFTAETAAALTDAPLPQARRLLGTLAAAHLVEPVKAGRYRFHDLLREYARETARTRETAAGRAAATDRLLLWYLHAVRAVAGTWLFPDLPPDLADSDRPDLRPPTDSARWLEEEQGNLPLLIHHAAQHGPRPVAWHLANALFGYFFLRLPRAAWHATAQAALAAATAADDGPGQATLHIHLGVILADRGDLGQALERHSRAHEISREIGWETGEAAAIGGRGQAEWYLARLDSAHENTATALRMSRALANPYLETLGLIVTGLACRDLGRLDEAATHLERAVALSDEIKWWDNTLALQNLGWVYWELGRLTDGFEVVTSAGPGEETGTRRHVRAAGLDTAARINLTLGRFHEALDQSTRAYAQAQREGRRWQQASILTTMAAAHRELAHLDRSFQLETEALAVARASGHARPEADSLLGLALTLTEMGRLDEARTHADQALTLARARRFRVVEGQALTALCAIAASSDAPPEAIELGEKALSIHRETGHRPGEARTLCLLADAHEKTDSAAAESMRRQARDILADIGVI